MVQSLTFRNKPPEKILLRFVVFVAHDYKILTCRQWLSEFFSIIVPKKNNASDLKVRCKIAAFLNFRINSSRNIRNISSAFGYTPSPIVSKLQLGKQRISANEPAMANVGYRKSSLACGLLPFIG